VVAKLIELFGRLNAQQFLDAGKTAAFTKERLQEAEPVSV
jgi:hypothetical protein